MKANRREFADIVGVSERAVASWMDEGMPAKRARKKGAQVEIETGPAIAWLCERGMGQPDNSIPTTVTRRQFAALLGCTPTAVSKWIAEGMPATRPDTPGHPLAIWTPEALRWLWERARDLSGRGRPPVAITERRAQTDA